MEDETERGDRFWNTNSVEMKFSTEKEWLRRVRFAENKPNYGMRDLDPVLGELRQQAGACRSPINPRLNIRSQE